MQLHQMEGVEGRVRAYWYADGWAEIVGGAVLVLLGIFFAGQGWLPESSFARALLAPALLLVLVGGGIATRRIVSAMKARFTYPRTGYISYRVDETKPRQRRFAAGIVGAVFAALLVSVAVVVRSTDWVPGITGILIGAILIYMKVPLSGLRRFYWMAGFCPILGIVLSFVPLSLDYRLAILYSVIGLAFMLTGGWNLRRYLRDNPLPAGMP
jgi:hypothetical protein